MIGSAHILLLFLFCDWVHKIFGVTFLIHYIIFVFGIIYLRGYIFKKIGSNDLFMITLYLLINKLLSDLTIAAILTYDISITEEYKNVVQNNSNNVIQILAICVIGPVAEEIVCRHIIFNDIYNHTKNYWYSAIVTSLIFSLMHSTVLQLPLAFISGMVFQHLVFKTGNLTNSIILHITMNTVGLAHQIL